MDVLIRDSRSTILVPVKTVLLSERKVFLEGEIDEPMADEFLHTIMFLLHNDREARISLYINSPGGNVQAGLKLYDIIKSLNSVDLYCTGLAASMAAILLAAGPKGHRYVLPHSKIMIHEPQISGGVGGSATSIQKTAESIMETRKLTVEILSSDTGKSKEEVEKAISYDHYMNPEEAIAFGIADQVIKAVF